MKISEHFDNKQVSRIDSYNIGDIKSFISTNERCARFIARSSALFDKNDNIHPCFKYILENYSENSKILDELASNIYNFS